MKDCKVWVGNWVDNFMEGYGQWYLKNFTRKYVGDFHKSLPHGFGFYVYEEHQMYEGNWQYGKQHGIGKVLDADFHEIWLGRWRRGVKDEKLDASDPAFKVFNKNMHMRSKLALGLQK